MADFAFHPEAKHEAVKASEWYSQRSAVAAAAFEASLAKAVSEVLANPDRWQRYLRGTHCYQLDRFPYALVYLPGRERVFGVAVVHLHRKPGYWKRRLG